MAGGGVLLAISGLLSLLHCGLCQGGVVEQPLSCFKSSPDCSVNEISLPYSQCCASGTEHFMINDTCYGCAELLSFTSSSFSVEEGAGFVSVQVQRSVNPGTNIFFFSTTINDITANAGIDYGQFPESGIGLINVILEGESLVGSGIVVFDDSVVEYNENFTVGLVALSQDFQPLGVVMDTATVTIIDDDQVDITLQPSEPVVVTEGASFLTYTLNKTGEAVRNVKVDIDLSDPELVYSTAEFSDSHIFEPDEFLYEIMVNVTNDMIVEATEDHMIFLRVPEGETGVNLPQDSVTITVEDDGDFVEIGFQTSIMNVSEESGSFSVGISKTGSNERPVSVRIFTVSASAIEGEDFTSIDMIVEFSAGDDLIKFIEVNISSDDIVEDIESFELRLEVPGNESSVILTINTTTISLEDTQFTVMVDEDERFLSVSEGESVSLTVRAAGAAFNRDLIVEVTPRDTMEIVVSPSIVVFNESKSEETVIVTGVDDEFFEGAESVQILITSSDPAVGLLPLPIQVNIEDNDPPQLQFSEAVYMFNETQGTAEIVVTFGAHTKRPHSWTLTSVPLTATEFEDYSQIDTTLQFDDNIREHRVFFQIFDDLLSEGLETFRLELRNTEDPNTVTTSSLVEIVDDEKLLVSFFGTSFTAYEGEPLFLLGLNKSGITTSDIRVEINFTDITAIGGVDYGYFPTSEFLAVTLILADETEVLYPILIRDDDIIENVESFNAVLQISDDTGTIILGAIHEAIIYIEDNDKLPVFLTGGGDGVISEEASESERTLEFIVSRDENVTLDRDVVVTLSTADGSARAASGDYGAIDVTFTFTATGALSFSESVFVEDDTTVEATEDFYVSLSGDSAAELPKNATVIYITDNDKIQVNFLDDEYTFNEGDGVATVILTKTGSNEIPVMVSVVTMTQDDTATAGADYNATILPVEFQMTQTQIPLIIPLIDDDILENTESFTVILAVTSGDSNVELGPRNETRITIIDNDDVTVQFLQEDYSGIEGEIISVGVVLSGSSGRIINVGVVSKAGTATEDDFSLPLSIIEFPPGQTSFNLSIELVNDDICDDPGESFTLRLESTDSNVLVGDIGNTTVVINDDDECMIQIINASPVEVQEPEVMTTIELCVELIGMFDRDVRFAAVAEELRDIPVEQQALAGVDFILMPTILTLQPAENIECFDVVIRGDMRTDDKMFSVRILPDEGLRTGRAEVNVTILDQDLVTTDPPIGLPVVEFSTDVYNVLESDGGVIITLIASPPPPNNTIVSVLFSTQDGSATAPDDYVSQTDVSVTIEGGEATISVAIIMDVVAETQETFEVLLSLPEDDEILVERVILGTLTRATVVINDDPGDIFVDDTVTGDPFFVVPLSLTPDSHVFDDGVIPSLCYEIHGANNKTFNLISDYCTSVNAFYKASTITPELNFISEIGVKAVDLNNTCVTISVSVDNDCIPEIHRRGNQVSSVQQRYNTQGIMVRHSGTSVRISVPNCAQNQLVMWIKCREVNQQPQLRFDVTRGLNLNPTSHGLLGQFWNIPVSVQEYELKGRNPYDLDEDALFLVEIFDPESSEVVRQFVAEFYPLSWDHNRPEPCLYAGDQQGGHMVEFRGSDPVVENNYRLYRTSGLFGTEFSFSMFQSALCEE